MESLLSQNSQLISFVKLVLSLLSFIACAYIAVLFEEMLEDFEIYCRILKNKTIRKMIFFLLIGSSVYYLSKKSNPISHETIKISLCVFGPIFILFLLIGILSPILNPLFIKLKHRKGK